MGPYTTIQVFDIDASVAVLCIEIVIFIAMISYLPPVAQLPKSPDKVAKPDPIQWLRTNNMFNVDLSSSSSPKYLPIKGRSSMTLNCIQRRCRCGGVGYDGTLAPRDVTVPRVGEKRKTDDEDLRDEVKRLQIGNGGLRGKIDGMMRIQQQFQQRNSFSPPAQLGFSRDIIPRGQVIVIDDEDEAGIE
ncbi:Uu.00g051440.m01.CDS01 [Anthostomella pinea]|uniref:Uu.00g051440.m01.CDS01 n=1 Tax=Anthostomella pinea TaxID=933095 RepID=A0AAI8YKB8_9PEZI|nr:Uu.00g051440.m01.CDS01 [Anthostomella pinea]